MSARDNAGKDLWVSARLFATADAERKVTKSGKEMTTVRCRLRCNERAAEGEERPPLWVRVIAFGAAAAQLANVAKGDPVAAAGYLQRGWWQPKDGAERETWTLVAEAARGLQAGSAEPRQAALPAKRERVGDFDDVLF